MRVTQNMISNNLLRNISRSYQELDKYMNQLSTGKKITKPSDDPVIAMKGMGYRSEVKQVQQFQRNLNEVYNWFDNTDAALDKATLALQRVRELTVQASNGTNDDTELESIAKEIRQIGEHLKEIANTKINDKYIFNGTNTNESPFDDSGNFVPNTESVKIEVSKGTLLKVNVDPKEVFGVTDDNQDYVDVFTTIEKLTEVLENGNSDEIDAYLGKLDQHITQVLNARADLGARMNRVELIENRLDQQEVIATQMMSNNEDVDYTEAITKLITQESLHRAALSAGARIIQPTLLDFLR